MDHEGPTGEQEIPYAFPGRMPIANATERVETIEPGEHSGILVTIAGRLMLLRRQGKVVFGDLRDSSGAVQLFANANVTERFEEFPELSLGDWIGVSGEIMRTRRGELSVEVKSWELLAQAKRGFGDKWRGISDPDLRYRQRYVDVWANPEVRTVFLRRSKIVAETRRYLEERGFIEVETPMLHTIPTGAMAKPFVTHHNALDMDLYLRIAPELFLKRLTVAGFERVYEIGRVFRNEGISPRHNPEFTMLELYQAYADYHDIMELTESLIAHLAEVTTGSTEVEYQGQSIQFRPPWRRASLEELTSESVGEEVSLEMDEDRLRSLLDHHGVDTHPSWGVGKMIAELYEKTTEHRLIQPTFVCDFPVEVSPLARPHRARPGRAERFEAFVAGRELANAFSELTDPDIQRARFDAQLKARESGDDEAMVLDEDYLRALEYGLPPTGGLGIGIDRLVMLLTNQAQIREVVLFPTMRPEIESDSGDRHGTVE